MLQAGDSGKKRKREKIMAFSTRSAAGDAEDGNKNGNGRE